jgi:hypothetical protein
MGCHPRLIAIGVDAGERMAAIVTSVIVSNGAKDPFAHRTRPLSGNGAAMARVPSVDSRGVPCSAL